jgi:hypothetical protein
MILTRKSRSHPPSQFAQRDLVGRTELGDQRLDNLPVTQPSLRAHVDAVEAARVSDQRSVAGTAGVGWISGGHSKGL